MTEHPASSPDLGPGAPVSGPISLRLPSAPPTVTFSILGLTIAVYLLQIASNFIFGSDLPIALGAKVNELIRAGEVWRLFTPMLLHGSIFHIGFNMYALYSFGVGLERRFGHGRFLLLYV
ncbi:MAG: rhomboid family intramembrane serine protease, partial [Chloroflexota bacterium]